MKGSTSLHYRLDTLQIKISWEDDVNIYLRETGQGVAWINLAQDADQWGALVNTAMNLEAP
jgi:hypothetical protein